MADLNFPGSPTNGQTYVSGATTWVYNSTKGIWSISSSGYSGYTGSKGLDASFNIDGGFPSSTYGGITSIDAGGV